MVHAGRPSVEAGSDDHLAARRRRETERQRRRLEGLTWVVVALTIVITLAMLARLRRGD